PAAVGVYFPRILSRQASGSTAPGFVEAEYYGYPTVAEYLLYWELSSENWRRLFSRLGGVLRKFKAFPYSIGKIALEEFYLQKTTRRVEQYLTALDPALRQILENEIVVNGVPCRPVSALEVALGDRIGQAYRDGDFCIMHGDYCFSNILYDVPSGIVRLIDPRGSFGERCVGIYGDQKYDLAKLSHSAEHGYDFLVNGLYTLQHNGKTFEYTLATRDCGGLVAALCKETIADLGYSHDEIQLLTSLLFLSMCPLHSEDPKRQLAMYVHGLRLLNTYLE
ncbi:MAG: hypothetical protein ACOYMS_05240, partial [Terrimicrobiaceae bacterium]